MSGPEVTSKDIAHAAQVLRNGGLVAFPTETVYGLGADARDPRAVARIFEAKGRPADHPVIVHLGAAEDMRGWGRDIPLAAWQLAERFWPGPLTLIVKRAPGVSDAITGRQDTVGLRVPGHPVALALLKAFGGGIAAPSANRFGRVSPTCAAHVVAELGDRVDWILDGGDCTVGLESTIVDLTGAHPRLLRPGAITASDLAEVLEQRPLPGSAGAPRASGSLAAHYAPDTPMQLVEPTAMVPAVEALLATGSPFAVLSTRPLAAHGAQCHWVHMPADADAYSRVLYARLRDVDGWGCEQMLVEVPGAGLAWDAVRDRLQRAATGAGRNPPAIDASRGGTRQSGSERAPRILLEKKP